MRAHERALQVDAALRRNALHGERAEARGDAVVRALVVSELVDDRAGAGHLRAGRIRDPHARAMAGDGDHLLDAQRSGTDLDDVHTRLLAADGTTVVRGALARERSAA